MLAKARRGTGGAQEAELGVALLGPRLWDEEAVAGYAARLGPKVRALTPCRQRTVG
jgi:hypothetical protein